ncbi:uncharacterized protein LOC116338260 [Contarinia nasturtii]|uniref:uncharacterized protein LOC116338260 n=1 Tax=Contarinia nasturtii TaxID=265458 RepID=UPI0012D4B975|nr:uncharacterized protein LOC116338260 [Contarinia nasturtii]
MAFKMSPKRKSIEPSILLEAVKRVKIGKESKKSVSLALKIPRTNLLRYLDNIERVIPDISVATDEDLLQCLGHSSTVGPTPIFTQREEKCLMEYILKCADLYYGLSMTDIKKLAFEFAAKIGVGFPPKWNEKQMAGRRWFDGFMKRHPNMSIRKPQQVSLNRMRGFTRENVDLFYSNLDRVTNSSGGGHEYGAQAIWNMDETGFSTVPNRIGKIVARKGARYVGMMSSQERGTLITMVACVSASGTYCPPFWIFPRKNMRAIFLERAPEGSFGVANGSGWIHQGEFVQFMQHFIKFSCASLERPQLLILDNHCSHLSVEAIDLAKNNGITMVSIPPHCSHKLQPLDVSVFGPFKAYYSNACGIWTKNNSGRVFEIHHIPEVLGQCIDLAFTPTNIKSGFKATGIRPFNRDSFTDSDFVVADFLAGEPNDQNMEIEDQRLIVFNDSSCQIAIWYFHLCEL